MMPQMDCSLARLLEDESSDGLRARCEPEQRLRFARDIFSGLAFLHGLEPTIVLTNSHHPPHFEALKDGEQTAHHPFLEYKIVHMRFTRAEPLRTDPEY